MWGLGDKIVNTWGFTITPYTLMFTSVSVLTTGMAFLQYPKLEIFPLSHPLINVLSGDGDFTVEVLTSVPFPPLSFNSSV